MATPIDDVIENLQTHGGTSPIRLDNFADQSSITFFIAASANGGMTAAEVTFVRLAFRAWGDLIGIPLIEIQDITAADILFTYVDLGKSGPAGQASSFEIFGQKKIEINRFFFVVGDTPTLGSTGFKTILHEIGHALGLSHPGPYNGDFFDDAVYGEDTTYPEDFYKFTVMSYFDLDDVELATGVQEAYWGTSFPWSPMLHDVAAIQSIYGANTATRAGDTVYGFNASNQQFNLDGILAGPNFGSEGVFTIWDGGGIDTIDASGAVADGDVPIAGSFNEFPNQIIDLRQGAFSSIGLDRNVRT